MCGLAGFLIGAKQRARADAVEIIQRMTDTLISRGPDDSGLWLDEDHQVALGHRRLSIVDLSPAGHQPMASHSGRYVVAFNGEIYNHLELRTELRQLNQFDVSTNRTPWRGHSDTETLLMAFETWGIEATLEKVSGMFAIALWDKREERLTLIRDRFGEKPLYYGWTEPGYGSDFVFGSELKALTKFPQFSPTISRKALALYMRFAYVPAPYSIYENIYKLEPGCILSVNLKSLPAPTTLPRPPLASDSFTLKRWWALADVVVSGAQNPVTDDSIAIELLEEKLANAVRQQSLADVPLGAFLSGGVDSSLIVALMQRQSAHPTQTFTVGFEESGFDESPHARAIASYLGTQHTELFVSSAEALGVIPQLPMMYDEPFADSSQIPTHLVCKAAHQQVTVALSGDAGDEMFGGYNRYFWGPRIWNKVSWLPYQVRNALGIIVGSIPATHWNSLGRPINAFLPGALGVSQIGDKAHKLASRIAGVRSIDDLYAHLVSEWQDPAIVVKGDNEYLQEPLSMLDDSLPLYGTELDQLRMMYRDSMTYLPDDILCKVDRAAMATSLETRVPFLDHHVAELAWRLPLHMKIRGNIGKWALRQVLYKYVPRELIERPKTGFGIPLGQWLRGPLRTWAEALLTEERLTREGYFHPQPIRSKWLEHINSQRDHTASLWIVLMFQSWLECTPPFRR